MDPISLSDHARDAVARERSRTEAYVEGLERQSERLHAVVTQIDADLASARRVLRQMDELLGLAPQLPLDATQEDLTGQRLREVAVALLRGRGEPGLPIHYTDWFKLLEDEGVRVGGKNPVATFLTQIGKAPEVETVRPRSGLYRLRSA